MQHCKCPRFKCSIKYSQQDFINFIPLVVKHVDEQRSLLLIFMKWNNINSIRDSRLNSSTVRHMQYYLLDKVLNVMVRLKHAMPSRLVSLANGFIHIWPAFIKRTNKSFSREKWNVLYTQGYKPSRLNMRSVMLSLCTHSKNTCVFITKYSV